MTAKCTTDYVNERARHILATLQEEYPDTLVADGWDAALIGITQRKGHTLAVYDANRIVQTLQSRDGMDYQEAVEYFDFNILGAWVGDGTPVYVGLHPGMDCTGLAEL